MTLPSAPKLGQCRVCGTFLRPGRKVRWNASNYCSASCCYRDGDTPWNREPLTARGAQTRSNRKVSSHGRAIRRGQRATVYRFYNESGQLLYIGETINPGRRFSEHRADKSWWDEISSITLEKYCCEADALAAEEQAIRLERPKYNVTYNDGTPIEVGM